MTTLNFPDVFPLGFETPTSLRHDTSGPTPLAIWELGRPVRITGETATALAAWLVPDAMSHPPPHLNEALHIARFYIVVSAYIEDGKPRLLLYLDLP